MEPGKLGGTSLAFAVRRPRAPVRQDQKGKERGGGLGGGGGEGGGGGTFGSGLCGPLGNINLGYMTV